MSVPSWKRNISKAQFLAETFQLNVEVGRIVMSKPKKYRQNYGDFLINSCLQLLQELMKANAIYLTENTKQLLKDERELCLKRAIGICDNISTSAYIFLELNKSADGTKTAKEEAKIGERCGKIISLIEGVIKSDKRFK